MSVDRCVMVDRYEGFREFVLASGPALARTAYLLTGDHGAAEDLLQNVLARTARHWPRVRAGGNPVAYVRRGLINERNSWWRRRKKPSTDDIPDRPTSHDQVEAATVRVALAGALRRLPGRQRAVIVLRYYEDLSEAETARVLGVTVGTVKSQASAALTRLRTLAPELMSEVTVP
jgi:RNA polymerase sigma-70 factor (sigma-E family)